MLGGIIKGLEIPQFEILPNMPSLSAIKPLVLSLQAHEFDFLAHLFPFFAHLLISKNVFLFLKGQQYRLKTS